MDDQNKRLFLEHAREVSPSEACAVLIIEKGIETLVICQNKAYGNDHFIIDKLDYSMAEDRGEIIAIIHSHPNQSPLPSEPDKVACSNSNLKWYIVGTITGEWFELVPNGYEAPLIGRNWGHGVLDCYSIIRDYYKRVLQIDLQDFDRPARWWKTGGNLYLENFAKAGFIQVPFDSLQKHDVILMQVESPVINHGGVYLGDGLFLHHLYKKLSSRDVYGGYWEKHTLKIVRYEGLTDAQDKTLR